MTEDSIRQKQEKLKNRRRIKEWLDKQTDEHIPVFSVSLMDIKAGDIKNAAHWLSEMVDGIENIDLDRISRFIALFVRMVTNIGGVAEEDGIVGLNRAFDAAIHFYIQSDRSPIDIYLSKFAYLGVFSNESEGRKEVLQEAIDRSAIASEDRVRAFLALAQYYTDISQYNAAIDICDRCRHILEVNPLLDRYRCRILTTIGICYFTSFQKQGQAEKILREACKLIEQYPSDPDVIRSTSTAYHYLGRLLEIRGDLSEAMNLYIIAKMYQDRCPEEILPNAFIHLRLGELLTGAGVFDHAKDHLIMSDKLFDINRNRGSGRFQANLGLALLEAAQGHHNQAKEKIKSILDDSQKTGFVRGDLLCLGFLMVLQLQHYEVRLALNTLRRIVFSILSGEIRRNNFFTLLVNLPKLFSIMMRRVGVSFWRKDRSQLLWCACSLHGPDRQGLCLSLKELDVARILEEEEMRRRAGSIYQEREYNE